MEIDNAMNFIDNVLTLILNIIEFGLKHWLWIIVIIGLYYLTISYFKFKRDQLTKKEVQENAKTNTEENRREES